MEKIIFCDPVASTSAVSQEEEVEMEEEKSQEEEFFPRIVPSVFEILDVPPCIGVPVKLERTDIETPEEIESRAKIKEANQQLMKYFQDMGIHVTYEENLVQNPSVFRRKVKIMMKTENLGIEDRYCKDCIFKLKLKVDPHEKREYNINSTYKCPQCAETFQCQSEIIRHVSARNRNVPNKCNIGNLFLSRHNFRHSHSDRRVCYYCAKFFHLSDSLRV